MVTQRKIIHCDCDCFFAAVEMRDNPSLAKIPLAIGGSVDRRGVIATCNYPAREYGVRSAMSSAHALRLCPSLTLISGNMEKYRQASRQVMAIFREYSERVEPLSLDEAFIDVSGSRIHDGSATLIAREIKRRVLQEVGICVSAGVAPNRFLAKIASDWQKPDGLFVIRPERVAGFLSVLPVDKLPGVGEKTAARLHALEVRDCASLQEVTLPQLQQIFGKFGTRLYQLARGIDDRPVGLPRQRKSVSVEHTYPRDLPNLESCLRQLPLLLDQLRQRYEPYRDKAGVRGAVVKVKFDDFSQTTAEFSMSQPTQSHYRQLLIDAWERGQRPVRLLGVGFRLANGIEGCQQLNLWSGVEST